jgi:anti-sigma factor RsiW
MFDAKPGGDLALEALLYAGGELPPAEAASFEARLASDQAAREALVCAVQANLSLSDPKAGRPDPAYRDRVRRQLAWAKCRPALGGFGLGAAAAALLIFTVGRPPAPDSTSGIGGHVPASAEQLIGARQAEEEDVGEAALIWADMSNHADHMSKAVVQENRRKSRSEERRNPRKSDEGRALGEP